MDESCAFCYHPCTLAPCSLCVQREEDTVNKEIIRPAGVYGPRAPYSSAVKAKGFGSLVFTAGVLPDDSEGNIVCKGDIVRQTEQIVRNLEAVLKAAGAAPGNVVQTTTYVVESAMEEFLKSSAFHNGLKLLGNPADTLVGVARLALSREGQLIEISAVAVIE